MSAYVGGVYTEVFAPSPAEERRQTLAFPLSGKPSDPTSLSPLSPVEKNVVKLRYKCISLYTEAIRNKEILPMK